MQSLESYEKFQSKLEKAARWALESSLDYERSMINTKRNQHRRERQFRVGDTVRVYQHPVGKTDKKVGRVCRTL